MLLDGHSSKLERLRVVLRDFPIKTFGLAILLSCIGLLFIHSVSFDNEESFGQDRKQALALVLLLAFAVPVAYLRRGRILSAAWPLYLLVLLALFLLPLLGVTINGARRWYRITSMTIQPAEFIKPALVLVLARYLRFKSQGGLVEGVLVPAALTLLPMLLLVRQPDLGSALSLLPVLFAMCYAAGARGRTLLILAVLGIVCLTLLFPFLHDYQKSRILVWLHQDQMSVVQRLGPGYHLVQSLIAVGSGGLTGDGLFEGVQNRFDFLPYRSTDFVFSVLAEETGFLGSSAVLFLYCGLAVFILIQAASIRDRFGRLLATGIGVHFATHLLIHVGVCTGALPTTGLPLPLLSYGRSSVTAAWIALALFAHALLQREHNLAKDRYL